jgi:hypothetical protein
MSDWWDGIRSDDPRYPYRGIEPIGTATIDPFAPTPKPVLVLFGSPSQCPSWTAQWFGEQEQNVTDRRTVRRNPVAPPPADRA